MSKKNAVERVESLEKQNQLLSEQVGILAEEIDSSRELMARIVEKLNIMISTYETHKDLSHTLVQQSLVKHEANKLHTKVNDLVKAGLLEATDSDIGDNNFIVGRELSESKEVIDEVVQFAMKSLPEESQTLLRGHKKGDLIKVEKSGTYIEILNVYNIKQEVVAAV